MQVCEDNLPEPQSTAQAVCLSGDLETRAFWDSIHCDLNLKNPKKNELLGVLAGVGVTGLNSPCICPADPSESC